MRLDAVLLSALVVAHHVVAQLHGGAHADLAIVMSPSQNAFIYVGIVAAPLLGAILVWTPYRSTGLGLVAIGMLAALFFGVYHHYMMVSPDHISHLPEGTPHQHGVFVHTAGALAMLEGVSAGVAAYFLGIRVRKPI